MKSRSTRKPRSQIGKQVVGNVGLFYVCYRLSCLGWNVMPTSRNAKGIDIVIYSQDASRKYTVQVKALSRRAAVPLGSKQDGLIADFVIICRNVASGSPECFVLKREEACKLPDERHKNGRTSNWLQRGQYQSSAFEEKWDRIGNGAAETLAVTQANDDSIG